MPASMLSRLEVLAYFSSICNFVLGVPLVDDRLQQAASAWLIYRIHERQAHVVELGHVHSSVPSLQFAFIRLPVRGPPPIRGSPRGDVLESLATSLSVQGALRL